MNIVYLVYVLTIFHVIVTSLIQEDVLSPFLNEEVIEIRRKNRQHLNFESIQAAEKHQGYSVNSFRTKINEHVLHGHRVIVYDAKNILSVLEPLGDGGCQKNKRCDVVKSSKQRNCYVAVNAGFFQPETSCHGNVISDGTVVHEFNSDVKSVNFGIRYDGSIVVGYFSNTFLRKSKKNNPFLQLVTGFGWILRNGFSYVNKSLQVEQCSVANAKNFAILKSARTFIGFDSLGYVHIVQIDGRTNENGLSLYDAVEVLQSFGISNAINLDGGGSSTFVINQTIVNYPSNICNVGGIESLCARNVSTILCIHAPRECENDINCSVGSICKKGTCKCKPGFYGHTCVSHGMSKDWLLYPFLIGLTVVLGTLLIYHIILWNLFLLYRHRYNELLKPVLQKDVLRRYLQSNHLLVSSGNDGENDSSS